MNLNDSFIALLKDCNAQLSASRYKKALQNSHKLLFWARGNPQIEFLASIFMAKACDGIRQHLFASEYKRYASLIREFLDSRSDLTDVNLIAQEYNIAIDPQVVSSAKEIVNELTFGVTKICHECGLPVLGEIENFLYANAHLVTEGSTYLSCMSWWLNLPIVSQGEDSSEKPIKILITAFDLGYAEEILSRFERTIQFLSEDGKGKIDGLPMITSAQTQHLGLIIRASTSDYEVLKQIGSELLEYGLPLKECPGVPPTGNADDFTRAGLDATQRGANLFSLALHKEAVLLYQNARDTQGYLMALLNEALTYRQLGQQKKSHFALLNAYFEAKSLDAGEILEMINTDIGFSIDAHDSSVLKEVDKILHQLASDPTRSSRYIFDSDSGKVVGGGFSEEAEAEKHVSEMLIRAWKEEFPNFEPPFRTVHKNVSFDANVPLKNSPKNKQNLELGISASLAPIAGTKRLSNTTVLMMPIGMTPNDYVEQFAQNVFRAIRVMHRALQGTFSSSTGTSISEGNITTRGHVFDYETVQSPLLEDNSNIESFQLVDLRNAIDLIVKMTTKVGRPDLLTYGIKVAIQSYTGRDELDDECNMDMKTAKWKAEDLTPKVAGIIARSLWQSADWR